MMIELGDDHGGVSLFRYDAFNIFFCPAAI
jgi:hypothetical protein